MKVLAALLMLLGFVCVSSAQTNIYNITQSQVTINNNITVITNVVQTPVRIATTNSMVVSNYVIERLQWDEMLDARRRASFSAYLRRFDKN
jgi:UTP-glucose-1-phosphate uridylyltransferase